MSEDANTDSFRAVPLNRALEALVWCGVVTGIAEGSWLVLARWGHVAWGGVWVVTAAFGIGVVVVQGGLTWIALSVLGRLPGLRRFASPPFRLGAAAVSAMVLLPAAVQYNKAYPGYGASLKYVGPYIGIVVGSVVLGLVAGFVAERLAAGAGGRRLRTVSRLVCGTFMAVCIGHFAFTSLLDGNGKGNGSELDPKRKPLNAVVISIDTLRADHLGSYGYGKQTDPNIQRHFREGLRFDSAYAAVPQTRPSHASMLTGRHPAHLRMRVNWDELPDGVPYLPEILRDQGYQTAGFVAAQPLFSRETGLRRGFDVYSDDFTPIIAIDKALVATSVMRVLTRLRLLEVVQRRAGSVNDDVLDWLEDRPPGPFFLFVHYYDPHGRYEPPPAEARAMGVRADQPHTDRGLTSRGPNAEFSEEEKELAHSLYDGEILYADGQIGRLLDGLEAAGHADDTVVFLLSDHAETLWERLDDGFMLSHGRWVDPWDLHIPFFIRGPGVPTGVVADVSARTEDVMPTLLPLLGLPVPAGLDGRDLITAARHGEDAVVLCFNSAADRTQPSRLCAKDGDYWYVLEPDTGVEALYDVDASHPQGRRNRIAEHPELVAKLKERLLALPKLTRDTESVDAVTLEQLKALGYVE